MKRATLLLVPLMAVALVLPAMAQDRPVQTGGKGNEETLSLRINGGAAVAFAWENQALRESGVYGHNRNSNPSASLDALDEGDYYVNGPVWIRFTASLQDNVEFVAVLRTRAYTDLTHGQAPNGSSSGVPGAAANPVTDRLNWGSDITSPVFVGDMYIRFKEVFDAAWSLTLGSQPVVFDIRGRGNAIFMDVTHAENPFPDAERAWGTLVRADSQPVGAKLTYSRDQFTFELGLFPILQTQFIVATGLALRSANEPGIYYIDLMVNIDNQGSKFGAIVALYHGHFPEDNVYTVGAGLVFVPQKDLEVFFEGYMQFGKVWSEFRPGLFGGVHGADGTAKGYAFQAGGRIDVPGDSALWAELVFVWVSGNDMLTAAPGPGYHDGSTGAGGFFRFLTDEVGEFLSYEGNNRMVIMDSNQWGFDWDNNIMQFVISGGVALSTGGAMKNNLHLILKLAYATAPQDWAINPSSGPGATPRVEESNYGFEVDATVKYMFNKNANVYLTLAYLSGADILAKFNREGETTAYVFLIGTEVNY